MSEVLEGEIVDEFLVEGADELTVDQQRIVLEAVRSGAQFNACARLAKTTPKHLRTVLDACADEVRRRLHPWALEVHASRARYEEKLRLLYLQSAFDEGKAQAYLNLLERQFREEWGKPNSSTVQHVHSFSDKVASLKQDNAKALPTGD